VKLGRCRILTASLPSKRQASGRLASGSAVTVRLDPCGGTVQRTRSVATRVIAWAVGLWGCDQGRFLVLSLTCRVGRPTWAFRGGVIQRPPGKFFFFLQYRCLYTYTYIYYSSCQCCRVCQCIPGIPCASATARTAGLKVKQRTLIHRPSRLLLLGKGCTVFHPATRFNSWKIITVPPN
jgi:hypothetical protein